MFFEGFPFNFFESKHSTYIGSWSIQWATIAHYSELNHKTGRTWQFSYPSRLGHNFSLLFWTKWEARDERKYPTLGPHWSRLTEYPEFNCRFCVTWYYCGSRMRRTYFMLHCADRLSKRSTNESNTKYKETICSKAFSW